MTQPDHILTLPDKTMTCGAMIMIGGAQFADPPKRTFRNPAKEYNPAELLEKQQERSGVCLAS